MDLKNNRILVSELLSNPAAREVLERRFPGMSKLPIIAMSGALPLGRALQALAPYIPQRDLRLALEELEKI